VVTWGHPEYGGDSSQGSQVKDRAAGRHSGCICRPSCGGRRMHPLMLCGAIQDGGNSVEVEVTLHPSKAAFLAFESFYTIFYLCLYIAAIVLECRRILKLVMWVKQYHKPPIWEWFQSHHGDDCGMVYGIVLPTLYLCRRLK